MYKYIIAILLVSVLGFGVWKYPKQEIVEVPVAVGSFGFYDDIAILALAVGDLEIAKKYIDKSGDADLLNKYQKHLETRAAILLAVEKGLEEYQVSKTEVDTVFKRLLSVESVDEVLEANHDVVVLLLLAKMSAEQGFRSWKAVADQLAVVSRQLESSDSKSSEILYEISQYRIDI